MKESKPLTADISLKEMWPLIEETLRLGGRFRFYPRGVSMRPLLRAGSDSVLLEQPLCIKRGDILLYKRKSGAFVLHRVMHLSADGTLDMCGDGQTSLERGIPRESVLARVAGIYRDDRYFDVAHPKLSLYASVHMRTRPVRRITGGVARRVRRLTNKEKN